MEVASSMLDGGTGMLIDNRTASELAAHARKHTWHADCADISVEHGKDCCIVWRRLPHGRTGWAEAYKDHNGSKEKAEAVARFKSARSAPRED